MVEFYPLTVCEINKTIRDAVVISLKPMVGTNFNFVQGQYLTFRRQFDGQELRRSYSICSGKDDKQLQVGIKRVDCGAFSTWANSELRVGDVLESMPPMGNFYMKADKHGAHYLAFAGGSGITPIMSILKTGLSREPSSKFTLVYANRNINTIMFREELEDLKNFYLGRLSLVHILEDESQDIDLFKGRIDGEKCRELFTTWIDIKRIDIAFICGPEAMMNNISLSLKAHGLNERQIRYELFESGQKGRVKRRPTAPEKVEDGMVGRVIIGGETRKFKILNDTSLLQAALDNNIDVPYACRAGICSTCKAKITEGEVEMVANHALEDYEVEAGFVLTCQCYPVSKIIVWDYDQTGH